MKTFGTYFSGGELAGVGFRNAGMEHQKKCSRKELWRRNYDPLQQ